MIKQKQLISFEEIKFEKDALIYDMDKDGNRTVDFYLPLCFNPEEKLEIKCGSEAPNLYIQVTEQRIKKHKTKLMVAMYMTIWDAPDRPEYDWDKIWLLPGQIHVFIQAINQFLKENEPEIGSYYELFKKFPM